MIDHRPTVVTQPRKDKAEVLFIVDMQHDFIRGPLGNPRADAVADRVAELIDGWTGDIVVTMDTHGVNGLKRSGEGDKYPPHCIEGTRGHALDDRISEALARYAERTGKDPKFIAKDRFSTAYICYNEHVTVVGLCTELCVLACVEGMAYTCNADSRIIVLADLTAPFRDDLYGPALDIMALLPNVEVVRG